MKKMAPKRGIVAHIAVLNAEDLEWYVPSSWWLMIDQEHDARTVRVETPR